MNKKLIFIASILVLLFVLFLLGPKEKANTKIAQINVPSDLEQYLKESESKYKDITPKTEKKIFWYENKVNSRTNYSVVYLHGFSATRQEYVPIFDNFAEDIGANIFYTRLRGHGRKGDALTNVSVSDWLTDGAEALAIGKRMGEKTIVVCSSTGCTIAVWLAMQEEWKDFIFSIVMLSPNFMPKSFASRMLLLPWGKQLLKLSVGDYYEWKPRNELQGVYWSTRYKSEVIYTMMKLVGAVDDLDLNNFTLPVLVIYNEKDPVVSASAIKEKFKQFGSPFKKKVPFEAKEKAPHVMAGDILAPEFNQAILEITFSFFQELEENFSTGR